MRERQGKGDGLTLLEEVETPAIWAKDAVGSSGDIDSVLVVQGERTGGVSPCSLREGLPHSSKAGG